eukprot:678841-Amphidinium_carterae.1
METKDSMRSELKRATDQNKLPNDIQFDGLHHVSSAWSDGTWTPSSWCFCCCDPGNGRAVTSGTQVGQTSGGQKRQHPIKMGGLFKFARDGSSRWRSVPEHE